MVLESRQPPGLDLALRPRPPLPLGGGLPAGQAAPEEGRLFPHLLLLRNVFSFINVFSAVLKHSHGLPPARSSGRGGIPVSMRLFPEKEAPAFRPG